MELPIIIKYQETLPSLIDQNLEDRVRIIDIDGVYLVTVMTIEKYTLSFRNIMEIAFDSLFAAKDFLRDDLDIDLESDQEPKQWRNEDYD